MIVLTITVQVHAPFHAASAVRSLHEDEIETIKSAIRNEAEAVIDDVLFPKGQFYLTTSMKGPDDNE